MLFRIRKANMKKITRRFENGEWEQDIRRTLKEVMIIFVVTL